MKGNNSYFDYDKFELKMAEKEKLNHVGESLYDIPKSSVALQGFCNNSGSPEYNMELSRNQIEAVTGCLVKNFKLDCGGVTAMWYGEGNPVACKDTAYGRAKQRSVEIAVTEL